MSDPLHPASRLLSALDLGPSWARDAVPRPAVSPKKNIEIDEAPLVRAPRRDDRRGDGGRERSFPPRRDDRGPRDDRRSPRRDDRDRSYDNAPDQQEFITPAPGVRVSVEPNADAIHLIAKEVMHFARVYSLFDIAKTLMSQRERFNGIFTVDPAMPPLYHGHRDNSLWLTKEDAVKHFWSAEWRGDLYEEEEIEIDGPAGNFQVVAKCGLSGIVFGPPNYHAYQSTIRQVHRDKFSNMPFDRYAAKIITERSEEAVQKWLHGMKTKLRWHPVGSEESIQLDERKDVEQHFLNNRFPEMYVATHRIEIPASTPVKLISPGLLVHFKNSARHAGNHPAVIIPTVCTMLEKEHLPVFKKQGKLFAGPSRPHPIPNNTTFSDRVAKIVECMSANPETKLAKLWKSVLPEGDQDPSKEWLADLFWLLSQGHLLLFADDTLILPLRRKAEASLADKKQNKPPENKAAKDRKKKPRRRRKSFLKLIETRVIDMTPLQRKRTRGFERTIAHRIRLKAAYRQLRNQQTEESSAEDGE